MKGAKVAADRQIELAMFSAWQTARLSTFTDKLEPMNKYLEKLKPQPPKRRQTQDEMIEALRAITASVVH